MQNIYTVLDKIRFDERVNEEIRILKQCKNTDNAILSDFVFKNFCFGLIRDFYDEILKENVANNVAKPTLQHLQAENNRLRETLKSQIKALLALKGFYPETFLFADDNIRRIRQALNGESEE